MPPTIPRAYSMQPIAPAPAAAMGTISSHWAPLSCMYLRRICGHERPHQGRHWYLNDAEDC